MIRPSPHLKVRTFRQTASQLIFAWGSVVSSLIYGILTLLGSAPLVDDHITFTALAMLGAYLLTRIALEAWLSLALAARRRERGRFN